MAFGSDGAAQERAAEERAAAATRTLVDHALILMVRSAAKLRVSNHEATGRADNRSRACPRSIFMKAQSGKPDLRAFETRRFATLRILAKTAILFFGCVS